MPPFGDEAPPARRSEAPLDLSAWSIPPQVEDITDGAYLSAGEGWGESIPCSTDLKLSLCLINTHELTIYTEHRQAFKERERGEE